MEAAVSRPNLVVVRAGEKSLHREWLDDSDSRSWDLVVSWYEAGPYVPVADEIWIRVLGSKLIGLVDTFERMPHLLERYEYVWLPDDDLVMNGACIDRLFRVMRQEKLLVAQPSLTSDSYFSWVHTLHCPFTRLRFTNLVEMMAPCFERAYLQTVLPHFPRSIAGWGLDDIWTRLADDNERKSAIIDVVSLRHTRPAGNLERLGISAGESPSDDADAVKSSFGLGNASVARCYGAKLARANIEIGSRALNWLLLTTYYLSAHWNPTPSRMRRRARRLFRQSVLPLDLSRLIKRTP